MATTIEYALMAGRAYQTSRDPGGSNWFPVPDGWSEPIDERKVNTSSGFEAGYFKRGTGANTEIVISFAGTDPLTVDQFANLGLATGAGSEQLLQAVDYYLAVTAANPSANIKNASLPMLDGQNTSEGQKTSQPR